MQYQRLLSCAVLFVVTILVIVKRHNFISIICDQISSLIWLKLLLWHRYLFRAGGVTTYKCVRKACTCMQYVVLRMSVSMWQHVRMFNMTSSPFAGQLVLGPWHREIPCFCAAWSIERQGSLYFAYSVESPNGLSTLSVRDIEVRFEGLVVSGCPDRLSRLLGEWYTQNTGESLFKVLEREYDPETFVSLRIDRNTIVEWRSSPLRGVDIHKGIYK